MAAVRVNTRNRSVTRKAGTSIYDRLAAQYNMRSGMPISIDDPVRA